MDRSTSTRADRLHAALARPWRSCALYVPALLDLAGFAVYLGPVGGEAVTTAMGSRS